MPVSALFHILISHTCTTYLQNLTALPAMASQASPEQGLAILSCKDLPATRFSTSSSVEIRVKWQYRDQNGSPAITSSFKLRWGAVQLPSSTQLRISAPANITPTLAKYGRGDLVVSLYSTDTARELAQATVPLSTLRGTTMAQPARIRLSPSGMLSAYAVDATAMQSYASSTSHDHPAEGKDSEPSPPRASPRHDDSLSISSGDELPLVEEVREGKRRDPADEPAERPSQLQPARAEGKYAEDEADTEQGTRSAVFSLDSKHADVSSGTPETAPSVSGSEPARDSDAPAGATSEAAESKSSYTEPESSKQSFDQHAVVSPESSSPAAASEVPVMTSEAPAPAAPPSSAPAPAPAPSLPEAIHWPAPGDVLHKIGEACSPVRAAVVAEFLALAGSNVMQHPDQAKYWRIRTGNPVYASKIAPAGEELATKAMQAMGFQLQKDSDGEPVFMLVSAGGALLDEHLAQIARRVAACRRLAAEWREKASTAQAAPARSRSRQRLARVRSVDSLGAASTVSSKANASNPVAACGRLILAWLSAGAVWPAVTTSDATEAAYYGGSSAPGVREAAQSAASELSALTTTWQGVADAPGGKATTTSLMAAAPAAAHAAGFIAKVTNPVQWVATYDADGDGQVSLLDFTASCRAASLPPGDIWPARVRAGWPLAVQRACVAACALDMWSVPIASRALGCVHWPISVRAALEQAGTSAGATFQAPAWAGRLISTATGARLQAGAEPCWALPAADVSMARAWAAGSQALQAAVAACSAPGCPLQGVAAVLGCWAGLQPGRAAGQWAAAFAGLHMVCSQKPAVLQSTDKVLAALQAVELPSLETPRTAMSLLVGCGWTEDETGNWHAPPPRVAVAMRLSASAYQVAHEACKQMQALGGGYFDGDVTTGQPPAAAAVSAPADEQGQAAHARAAAAEAALLDARQEIMRIRAQSATRTRTSGSGSAAPRAASSRLITPSGTPTAAPASAKPPAPRRLTTTPAVRPTASYPTLASSGVHLTADVEAGACRVWLSSHLLQPAPTRSKAIATSKGGRSSSAPQRSRARRASASPTQTRRQPSRAGGMTKTPQRASTSSLPAPAQPIAAGTLIAIGMGQTQETAFVQACVLQPNGVLCVLDRALTLEHKRGQPVSAAPASGLSEAAFRERHARVCALDVIDDLLDAVASRAAASAASVPTEQAPAWSAAASWRAWPRQPGSTVLQASAVADSCLHVWSAEACCQSGDPAATDIVLRWVPEQVLRAWQLLFVAYHGMVHEAAESQDDERATPSLPAGHAAQYFKRPDLLSHSPAAAAALKSLRDAVQWSIPGDRPVSSEAVLAQLQAAGNGALTWATWLSFWCPLPVPWQLAEEAMPQLGSAATQQFGVAQLREVLATITWCSASCFGQAWPCRPVHWLAVQLALLLVLGVRMEARDLHGMAALQPTCTAAALAALLDHAASRHDRHDTSHTCAWLPDAWLAKRAVLHEWVLARAVQGVHLPSAKHWADFCAALSSHILAGTARQLSWRLCAAMQVVALHCCEVLGELVVVAVLRSGQELSARLWSMTGPRGGAPFPLWQVSLNEWCPSWEVDAAVQVHNTAAGDVHVTASNSREVLCLTWASMQAQRWLLPEASTVPPDICAFPDQPALAIVCKARGTVWKQPLPVHPGDSQPCTLLRAGTSSAASKRTAVRACAMLPSLCCLVLATPHGELLGIDLRSGCELPPVALSRPGTSVVSLTAMADAGALLIGWDNGAVQLCSTKQLWPVARTGLAEMPRAFITPQGAAVDEAPAWLCTELDAWRSPVQAKLLSMASPAMVPSPTQREPEQPGQGLVLAQLPDQWLLLSLRCWQSNAGSGPAGSLLLRDVLPQLKCDDLAALLAALRAADHPVLAVYSSACSDVQQATTRALAALSHLGPVRAQDMSDVEGILHSSGFAYARSLYCRWTKPGPACVSCTVCSLHDEDAMVQPHSTARPVRVPLAALPEQAACGATIALSISDAMIAQEPYLRTVQAALAGCASSQAVAVLSCEQGTLQLRVSMSTGAPAAKPSSVQLVCRSEPILPRAVRDAVAAALRAGALVWAGDTNDSGGADYSLCQTAWQHLCTAAAAAGFGCVPTDEIQQPAGPSTCWRRAWPALSLVAACGGLAPIDLRARAAAVLGAAQRAGSSNSHAIALAALACVHARVWSCAQAAQSQLQSAWDAPAQVSAALLRALRSSPAQRHGHGMQLQVAAHRTPDLLAHVAERAQAVLQLLHCSTSAAVAVWCAVADAAWRAADTVDAAHAEQAAELAPLVAHAAALAAARIAVSQEPAPLSAMDVLQDACAWVRRIALHACASQACPASVARAVIQAMVVLLHPDPAPAAHSLPAYGMIGSDPAVALCQDLLGPRFMGAAQVPGLTAGLGVQGAAKQLSQSVSVLQDGTDAAHVQRWWTSFQVASSRVAGVFLPAELQLRVACASLVHDLVQHARAGQLESVDVTVQRVRTACTAALRQTEQLSANAGAAQGLVQRCVQACQVLPALQAAASTASASTSRSIAAVSRAVSELCGLPHEQAALVGGAAEQALNIPATPAPVNSMTSEITAAVNALVSAGVVDAWGDVSMDTSGVARGEIAAALVLGHADLPSLAARADLGAHLAAAIKYLSSTAKLLARYELACVTIAAASDSTSPQATTARVVMLSATSAALSLAAIVLDSAALSESALEACTCAMADAMSVAASMILAAPVLLHAGAYAHGSPEASLLMGLLRMVRGSYQAATRLTPDTWSIRAQRSMLEVACHVGQVVEAGCAAQPTAALLQLLAASWAVRCAMLHVGNGSNTLPLVITDLYAPAWRAQCGAMRAALQVPAFTEADWTSVSDTLWTCVRPLDTIVNVRFASVATHFIPFNGMPLARGELLGWLLALHTLPAGHAARAALLDAAVRYQAVQAERATAEQAKAMEVSTSAVHALLLLHDMATRDEHLVLLGQLEGIRPARKVPLGGLFALPPVAAGTPEAHSLPAEPARSAPKSKRQLLPPSPLRGAVRSVSSVSHDSEPDQEPEFDVRLVLPAAEPGQPTMQTDLAAVDDALDRLGVTVVPLQHAWHAVAHRGADPARWSTHDIAQVLAAVGAPSQACADAAVAVLAACRPSGSSGVCWPLVVVGAAAALERAAGARPKK